MTGVAVINLGQHSYLLAAFVPHLIPVALVMNHSCVLHPQLMITKLLNPSAELSVMG